MDIGRAHHVGVRHHLAQHRCVRASKALRTKPTIHVEALRFERSADHQVSGSTSLVYPRRACLVQRRKTEQGRIVAHEECRPIPGRVATRRQRHRRYVGAQGVEGHHRGEPRELHFAELQPVQQAIVARRGVGHDIQVRGAAEARAKCVELFPGRTLVGRARALRGATELLQRDAQTDPF